MVEIELKGKKLSSQDNTVNVLMSEDEIWFLKRFIKKYHPKKIVEIGISAGGNTVNLLKWKDKDAELHSIDLATQWHKDPTKLSGFMADELDEKDNWKLYRGYDYLDVYEEIGKDIDFIIIDTTHTMPGEFLTFISALPQLKDGCIVVLHDIHLNMRYFRRNEFGPYNIAAYCTGLLHGGISSEKKWSLKSEILSNISAFVVDESTRNNIKDIFHLLCCTWYSFPNELNLEGYSKFILENYSKDCYNLFNTCLKFQQNYFNHLQNVTHKITKIDSMGINYANSIKYDDGIASNHNDIWTLNNATLIREDKYSMLTPNNIGNLTAYTNIPNKCTIEFEILQIGGDETAFFAYFGNETNPQLGGFSIKHCNGSLNTWIKVIIDLNQSKYEIINKDKKQSIIRKISDTNVTKFSFWTPSNHTKICFRNFKVYPPV